MTIAVHHDKIINIFLQNKKEKTKIAEIVFFVYIHIYIYISAKFIEILVPAFFVTI